MSHPLAESPSMVYGVAYGGAREIVGLSICSEVARGIIWRVLRTSIASQPYLPSPDTSRGFFHSLLVNNILQA